MLHAGDSFVKVIGGGQTSLEALLIKRRIKGPCWLRLAQPERIADSSRQVREPCCKVVLVRCPGRNSGRIMTASKAPASCCA